MNKKRGRYTREKPYASCPSIEKDVSKRNATAKGRKDMVLSTNTRVKNGHLIEVVGANEILSDGHGIVKVEHAVSPPSRHENRLSRVLYQHCHLHFAVQFLPVFAKQKMDGGEVVGRIREGRAEGRLS